MGIINANQIGIIIGIIIGIRIGIIIVNWIVIVIGNQIGIDGQILSRRETPYVIRMDINEYLEPLKVYDEYKYILYQTIFINGSDDLKH